VASRRYSELLESIEARQHSRRGTFEEALAVADPLPRGRALDVPCGPGRMAEALGRLGFTAFGADLDAAGYEATVPFCTLDLNRSLPYAAGSFGFVYCGDGIEHLENPFLLLRELARVLADDGVLVVVTPNYLNVERRLQFLLTGSLAKPPRRVARYYDDPPYDRGHINPLTLTRLAYMAENAGLQLTRSTTLIPRRGQRWLAPLAWLIRAIAAGQSATRRRDLFADHSQSLSMLMGGKQLLACFCKSAKSLAPRAAQPAER
jgi:SAM-dependent methyltransferase